MKITMSKHRNDAQPGAKRQVHRAHLLGMIVVAASVFTVGRVDAAIVPTDLSGVQLWLKADAGVTESSGVVTSWDDQSGLGRNAVAPAGNEPTFVSSLASINNMPTLRFDATQFLTIADRVLTSDVDEFTMFAVSQSAVDDNASIIGFRSGAGSPLIQLDQQGGSAPNLGKARFIVRNAAGNGTANALGNIHTGTFGVYGGMVSKSGSTSTASILFNGEVEGTASASFGAAPDFGSGQQRIGGVGARNDDFQWEGDIAEVIVYNRALSANEIVDLGAYFEDKYAIDHPDPVEIPPLDVPETGLELWLKADGDMTVDGDGHVSTWNDASGKVRNASSAADHRPEFVSNVGELNNQSALRFDGADDAMQVASNVLAAGVQEFTMIAVAKAEIDNNASIIGFRSSGAPLIQLDQQGGAAPNLGKARFIVRNAANSGTANALGEIHTGSYGIYTGEVSKDEGSGISTVRVLFGGVEEGLATANFGNTPDFGSGRQWIGGTESNDTGTANFSWDGDIAEILVYSRVLSQSELDEIGTYLNAKYNVAYVPEPSAVALVVVSLVCSVLASRRRTAA